MTDAIWPETLTPTVCMSRKFCGSSFRPILWMTREDIGKAEMPAAPIMGLIFLPFGRNQVQELGHQNTARRVEDEGHEAEAHDEQRLRLQELHRVHVERDGDAEEDRDKVRQHLLRRLGQRVQHAALANQVAEHQEADERDCLRGKDARDDRDDDGEENACCFGDLLRLIRHADESLLLRCQQADDGGWTMGTSAI